MIEGSSISVDYSEWSDRVIDTANELSVGFVFWFHSSPFIRLQSSGYTHIDEFVCVYRVFSLTTSVHYQMINNKTSILKM